MKFKTVVRGQILDVLTSKNGKPYVRIYDGVSLLNIFVKEDECFEIGQQVELSVSVVAKDSFISTL